MNQKIQRYWQEFCQTHNLKENTIVDAYAFGATDQEASELADLVNRGIKTATTSAYEGGQLPKPGEYSIILDGNDEPVCVVQEKVVEIVPYRLISKEHAYHEGEGDRSYDYWKKVHDKFFKKEFCEQLNKEFTEDALMVCEVFEKVG